MDRRETKVKDDDDKAVALELTRASLTCVRRAFANIEAMAVVKRKDWRFEREKVEKKRPRGGS